MAMAKSFVREDTIVLIIPLALALASTVFMGFGDIFDLEINDIWVENQ